MKKTAKKKAVKQPSTSHHEFDISSDHLSETEKRPTERLVKDLFLDPKNPRLADTPNTGTQASIMKAMARDFDLQPLIDSLYKNGLRRNRMQKY